MLTPPAYLACSLQAVFREVKLLGYLIFRGAWRLDAFSAYPFAT